jgi:hypothetical protein
MHVLVSMGTASSRLQTEEFIMIDLLDLALDAHGGLERWRQIQKLSARLSVTGGLWKIKGQPAGLPNVLLQLEIRRPWVTIAPFAGEGSGHFTPDRVWVEDGQGNVTDERNAPRASFAGHVLATQWDKLQELYFISYAMWNYLTTPFLLAMPGFELNEIDPHEENGEIWRRLHVKFPSDIPTHCAEQVFFFNEKGLLQRLDYVTDVAGGVASHYCFDHAAFGEIIFPTLRRVVRRTAAGPALSSPTAVLLQLSDIVVS